MEGEEGLAYRYDGDEDKFVREAIVTCSGILLGCFLCVQMETVEGLVKPIGEPPPPSTPTNNNNKTKPILIFRVA